MSSIIPNQTRFLGFCCCFLGSRSGIFEWTNHSHRHRACGFRFAAASEYLNGRCTFEPKQPQLQQIDRISTQQLNPTKKSQLKKKNALPRSEDTSTVLEYYRDRVLFSALYVACYEISVFTTHAMLSRSPTASCHAPPPMAGTALGTRVATVGAWRTPWVLAMIEYSEDWLITTLFRLQGGSCMSSMLGARIPQGLSNQKIQWMSFEVCASSHVVWLVLVLREEKSPWEWEDGHSESIGTTQKPLLVECG